MNSFASPFRRRLMLSYRPLLSVNPNYKIVEMQIEENGYYQDPNANKLSHNSSYCTTYYYEIENFDSVRFYPEYSTGYSFVYDENYNRLGKAERIQNARIKDVYPEAKYVRFSGPISLTKNPFMIFYNTINYVYGNYKMPETNNIKLFRSKIAIGKKYLPASGVETSMSSYSISRYYELTTDRFMPFSPSRRSYCHAYNANKEWLFNLGGNLAVKGRDETVKYIRVSDETIQFAPTKIYRFDVMYNFENIITP